MCGIVSVSACTIIVVALVVVVGLALIDMLLP